MRDCPKPYSKLATTGDIVAGYEARGQAIDGCNAQFYALRKWTAQNAPKPPQSDPRDVPPVAIKFEVPAS